MLGMGRECGSPSDSPSWSRRSSVPASTRAAFVKGGILISPRSQTNSLRSEPMIASYVGFDILSTGVRSEDRLSAR